MAIDQLTGTRLGDYQVRELLGSGGMASVYRGYDPALDREVAIKVIHPSAQSKDFAVRFQREARMVAKLRHPNIVQIYHFGIHENTAYMVQELLTGPTLEKRIRDAGRRRMSPERVQTIIAQLASALDFAHAQGIIHRDVKPSNALYNAQGQLVLTDFGIARGPQDMARTATGPGVVMGTPSYVAPEQAISSATITPACDIYALGVVLFELVTGQLPFVADTPMGVILKHLYDAPPTPSSLRPDLPPALDALILKALSKEPNERFASAGALAKALQSAWPQGRSTASASSNGRARSTPANGTEAPTKARAASANSAARRTPKPAARTTPKPPAASAARATPTKSASQPNARAARTPAGNKRVASTPNATPAPRRTNLRLRVGLLTLTIVSALLLFGFRPNALAEAWQSLLPLLGR
jgi:serine/threonine protein kinase